MRITNIGRAIVPETQDFDVVISFVWLEAGREFSLVSFSAKQLRRKGVMTRLVNSPLQAGLSRSLILELDPVKNIVSLFVK